LEWSCCGCVSRFASLTHRFSHVSLDRMFLAPLAEFVVLSNRRFLFCSCCPRYGSLWASCSFVWFMHSEMDASTRSLVARHHRCFVFCFIGTRATCQRLHIRLFVVLGSLFLHDCVDGQCGKCWFWSGVVVVVCLDFILLFVVSSVRSAVDPFSSISPPLLLSHLACVPPLA